MTYHINTDRSTETKNSSRHWPNEVAPSTFGEVLWRKKTSFLLSILLCLGGGLIYLWAMPARYSATASILLDPRLGKIVGGDPNVPGFVVDTAAIDSQIELLTSQTVLSRVALSTDLQDDPEFNGSDRSILQRILHPSLSTVSGVDLNALEDAISISSPKRTYVVEIRVLARNNEKAAAIANAITASYIADQINARVGSAKKDAQFVATKLDTLSTEIQAVDERVEAYKAANKIVETAGLRSNEQQVMDLTKALGDARAKKSDVEGRLSEIRLLAVEGRLDTSSDALKSPTIERLRQQQAESEQSVARMSTTFGGHHPEMIEARNRQKRLVELVRGELDRVKEGLQTEFTAAENNEKQILSEIDRVKAQSADISRRLVPLDEMLRNRAVLRSSFDRFAQVNDTLLQQGAQSPPARIIAVARPAVSPSNPRKAVVGLVSLSFGAFIGLVSVALTESMPPSPSRKSGELEDLPAAPRQAQKTGKRRRRRQIAKSNMAPQQI